MRFLFVIFLIHCITIRISAQNEFTDDITSAGYDTKSTEDLSEKAKVKIKKQPSLAFVNISGIDKLPTSKTSEIPAWAELYDGNGKYFKKRITIKTQGNSSSGFAKKNFSVSFMEDEWIGEEKTDITIGTWVKQDGFHLKAYYTDVLRGAGAVSYKIFDRIIDGRPSYLERAGKTHDNERCYPDGFPCLLYLNGGFYGIYSWQLKKDRKNMGMDKKTAEEIHLDGELRNFWYGTTYWNKFEIRNPKKLYTSDGSLYDGDNPMPLLSTTDSAYMGGGNGRGY